MTDVSVGNISEKSGYAAKTHDQNKSTNSVLVVDVSYIGTEAISFTAGGLAMTLAKKQPGDASAGIAEIWYLVDPPDGIINIVPSGITNGAFQVSVSFGVMSLGDCDQDTPTGNTEAVAASSDVITPTNSGNLVVSIITDTPTTTKITKSLPTGSSPVFDLSPGSATVGRSDYKIASDTNDITFTYAGAGGAYGMVLAEFNIVQGPPIITTTPAGYPILTKQIEVNSIIDGDGGVIITERGIVYNTTGTPTTTDDTVVVAGTVGAFTAITTGLTEYETYYIRSYAINSEGTTYSPEISVTVPYNFIPNTTLFGFTKLT